ncbi:MAG: N-formylglutamate amidohydrolase [Hyphomicrobiales bacterium]|nr:N-formylglutamate amidohydrolase [Hyphomicrobiales bacterium]
MVIHSATDDPAANGVVEVINPSAKGDFVLVCEHASNFIPAELHDLGLTGDAVKSHIAWDPGALRVAREMSSILGAPLVAQRVSRLVYDCNRPPEAQSAVPAESEIYRIPGNVELSAAARRARIEQYYAPFRDALAACLDRRMATGRAPVIVTVHSFTPVFKGVRRDLDIGVLHDADSRFADVLLTIIEAETGLVIRRNEPYGPQDGVTHTLIAHALPRGLLNVMLEIRHDLIADAASQRAMAELLSECLVMTLAAIGETTNGSERAQGAN